MTKSFESTLSDKNSALWGFHCLVPTAVSEFYLSKDIKRLICKINGDHQISCALTSRGDGNYLIRINKEIRKKYQLESGDTITLEVWPDESKYGMPIPEELEELLKQDPEADKLFHALTPGKQRSLLFMVGKPKSSAIRLNKALGVTEYLKTSGGKVDLRELQVFMRGFRTRL